MIKLIKCQTIRQIQKQPRPDADRHGTDIKCTHPTNKSALQVLCTFSDSLDTHHLKADMKSECS